MRSIQLNDAHVFCALDQVRDEAAGALRLMHEAHAALGVEPSSYQLSLRGAGGKYDGDDEMWVRAGRMLRDVLDQAGVPYEVAAGEAAFYGPKIDVQIADPAGREATLSTVQVDFHMPKQFDLRYIDPAGAKSRPVMVHRSLIGSMERLFAHLIEAHAGSFPVWYAPVQIAVLPVEVDRPAFAGAAIAAGLRVSAEHDGSLGNRIRAAAARKIPYVAVIGPREAADGLVSLRLRDGRQLPPMPGAAAIDLVSAVAAARSAVLLPIRPPSPSGPGRR